MKWSVGVRLTKKKLEALRHTVPASVVRILNEEVQGGAELAKGLSPVDTGFMRENIHAEPAEFRGRKVTARLLSPAPYSAFVEFGTARGAPSQPFFMPAVESIRRGLEARLKKAVAE